MIWSTIASSPGVSGEMDVRVGGTYRLVFSHPASPTPMAFFGRYLEVAPQLPQAPKRRRQGADRPPISRKRS